MSNVVEHRAQPPAAPTPAHMLQVALEKGASMEQLEKLLDLQERWEATEARKAYVKAMAAFKANPPDIVKDKTVAFGNTRYTHVSLPAVVDAVSQSLSKHGLSHRWDVEQNGIIKVTCVITHELGHSEAVSMSAPADASGQKNAIQQIASTVAYLERYTLMAATGLAAKDMDDDAKQAGQAALSDEQAAEIKALLQETNSDVPAFLKAMGGAESVDELPAGAYPRAMALLNKKLRAQRNAS